MMIDFKKELAEKTAAIDTIVNSYLPEASGEAEYIKSAMDYSVQAGGKRVRPMIMLETYRLCGGTMITEEESSQHIRSSERTLAC